MCILVRSKMCVDADGVGVMGVMMMWVEFPMDIHNGVRGKCIIQRKASWLHDVGVAPRSLSPNLCEIPGLGGGSPGRIVEADFSSRLIGPDFHARG